ncbi:MAG: ATP-binding cassette domain-containing protein, partial [Clostridiales bacterium]|nr:ATP-binding cassette domain-containing protein [Clostridiales bacterium]
MKDLLCLKGVSLVYHSKEGETLAVKDLSFCLRKNEYLSVVGPSGCGKTTVLSLISGLLRPSDGHVYIGGEEVIKPSASVGYMLQRDQLFEWRTIRENVVLGLEIQRKKNAATLAFADNLLDKYGLSEFKSHYPRQLSG